MQKNSIIIVIIAVLVLGGGAYALMKKSDKSTPAATTSTSQSSDEDNNADKTPATNSADQVAAATITYKDGSFSPSTVTIKSGDTVNIINNSTTEVDFESDPHPTHTDNTELNAGEIAPGNSTKITIQKTGNWGYHNHANSSEAGTIVVQ